MSEHVVLRECSNHVEAEIEKNILEAYEIKAMIQSDDCGGMSGGQTYVRGVKLLVCEKDVKKAKKVLGM